MQTNLFWTGREYHSMENCLVSPSKNGITITSTLVGYYENKIYKVMYTIKTNNHWETLAFEINSQHSNKARLIKFEGDGKGNWISEGQEAIQFKGCIDIDIPLTPFTNTLPINRLSLKQNETREIEVIYLDLLAQQIKRVKQKYVRLSLLEYKYENIPNDFEAVIQVDESGFVVDYPQLFSRTAVLEADY